MYENGALHHNSSACDSGYRVHDGSVYCDWSDFLNLATKRGRRSGSTSNQRTGTLPYLALELLREGDCEHRFRHDLESIMYCVMDMTMEEVWVPVGTGGVLRPALWAWRQLSMGVICGQKHMFIHSPPTPSYERYKPHFAIFLEVVLEWRVLFLKFYNHLNLAAAMKVKEVDYETCGGIIDCQKFVDVLS